MFLVKKYKISRMLCLLVNNNNSYPLNLQWIRREFKNQVTGMVVTKVGYLGLMDCLQWESLFGRSVCVLVPVIAVLHRRRRDGLWWCSLNARRLVSTCCAECRGKRPTRTWLIALLFSFSNYFFHTTKMDKTFKVAPFTTRSRYGGFI